MDTNNRPSNSNHKPVIYYISAILILITALSVAYTNLNYYTLQSLKSSLSQFKPPIFNRAQRLLNPRLPQKRQPKTPNPNFCVLWMAPFLSVGGYSSEAWSYITAIHKNAKEPLFRLAIEHHGDLESIEFWEGLPQTMKALALQLHSTQCRKNETIVICHSEPGAWYPPLFQTFPCPPSSRYGDFLSVIGRTMFETDRVNSIHVERCNKMDSVWVPTDFHVSTFVQSGVEPSKVVKIVQPVDVEFFDPSKYNPLPLQSMSKSVLGPVHREEFVFLSVFKWEYRKGWDVLLRAYLEEFSPKDGVALYMLTNPYHTEGNFGDKIAKFVLESGLQKPDDGWASTLFIDKHIAHVDLPRLYKSADAFVLPSRGEGWGRPVVEAMAMSLPVIATNWSGQTEYLTEENGYPLPVDSMSEVTEGPFKGHLWAEPKVDRLRALMRHVLSNPEDAMVKGRRAREDMMTRFSPQIVAEIVTDHIHRILKDKT